MLRSLTPTQIEALRGEATKKSLDFFPALIRTWGRVEVTPQSLYHYKDLIDTITKGGRNGNSSVEQLTWRICLRARRRA